MTDLRLWRVGVAVLLWNVKNQLLMGQRLGDHGGGTWSFPGGHVEHFEYPVEAAAREVLEETGMVVQDLRMYLRCPYLGTKFSSGKHYITLYFEGEIEKQTPIVREPDKCAEWRWFEPDELPSPLFAPIEPVRLCLGKWY